MYSIHRNQFVRQAAYAGILLCAVSLTIISPTYGGGTNKIVVTTIGKVTVWKRPESSAFFYTAGLAIDADGAPKAYHPLPGKGLDDLKNAGRSGNWWALVTDTGKSDGNPLIQKPNDPAPGYYISMTALEDTTKNRKDPHHYVDASTIPYIVLPPKAMQMGKAKRGDFAFVVNTRNQKTCYAIFADIGPADKIGEGSIALANAIGINSNARTGGTDRGIVYLIFPGSGDGKPHSSDEIKAAGEKQFKAWGNVERLLALTKP